MANVRALGRWAYWSAVAVGLLSAVGLLAAGRWEHAARFLLLTGAMALVRRAGVPPLFAGCFAVMVLGATWASVQHWYRAVDDLDLVVHVLSPGAVAAAGYFVLARYRLLPDVRARDPGLRGGAPVLWVTLVGTAAAVVWELYEWVVEQVAPVGMIVGYTDTVGDLLAGMLGSAGFGALTLWWARRRRLRR